MRGTGEHAESFGYWQKTWQYETIEEGEVQTGEGKTRLETTAFAYSDRRDLEKTNGEREK